MIYKAYTSDGLYLGDITVILPAPVVFHFAEDVPKGPLFQKYALTKALKLYGPRVARVEAADTVTS